jgi:hypothetical protein
MEKITETDSGLNIEKPVAESIEDIVRLVGSKIIGRLANKYRDIELDNVHVLLDFISRAGGGNHLEIGTLFGGSAIAVALLKLQLGQAGVIVCIDPLNGYYKMDGSGNDVSGIPVTPETLFRNIENFFVEDRILVMRAYSQLCSNLNIQFSTAYIDGDHKRGAPLNDWFLVKDMVSKYVIFDNCDELHPDVMSACEYAELDTDWQCVYNKGISFVVEKIVEMPLATLDMLERI